MNIFIMLRNQKNLIVRGIFLISGWGLGLDRFHQGDKKVFLYQSLVGVSHSLALSFLNVQDMNMLME